MRKILLVLLYLLGTAAAQAATPLQRMQQLVDYVGVDYPGAVAGGEVVNPVEYAEMLDFSRTIQDLAEGLPVTEARPEIRTTAALLNSLVTARSDAHQVSEATGKLRQLLINGYDLAVTPARTPDLQRGKALFAQQCTSCHGVEGKGNGPLASTLEPAPTNFTDLDRYRQRTLHGLYSTITHGVNGTAMKSYAKLPDNDRWALAFYVGQLAPTDLMKFEGKQVLLAGSIALD